MSASAFGPVGATSSYTLSIASAYHCRQRAAPGTSTFRLSEMGFPMSSVSRSASSSVCGRRASAKRSRIFLRFPGGVSDQTPLRNAARRGDRAVDVLLVAGRHPREELARAPVDGVEGRAGGGVHVAPVDEGLGAELERAGALVPGIRVGYCVHGELGRSESLWGAGADDLTRLASDVAEAVRELTGEIICLAGAEHARGAPHRELV